MGAETLSVFWACWWPLWPLWCCSDDCNYVSQLVDSNNSFNLHKINAFLLLNSYTVFFFFKFLIALAICKQTNNILDNISFSSFILPLLLSVQSMIWVNTQNKAKHDYFFYLFAWIVAIQCFNGNFYYCLISNFLIVACYDLALMYTYNIGMFLNSL